MRCLGLTNFLLENISLFVNTFATIFALIFCFVSGVGIVFIFIVFPLGYIMDTLLSIPFLIFLFFLFVSIDIFLCLLVSIAVFFNKFRSKFGASTAPWLLYGSHFSTHISYATLKWQVFRAVVFTA